MKNEITCVRHPKMFEDAKILEGVPVEKVEVIKNLG